MVVQEKLHACQDQEEDDINNNGIEETESEGRPPGTHR